MVETRVFYALPIKEHFIVRKKITKRYNNLHTLSTPLITPPCNFNTLKSSHHQSRVCLLLAPGFWHQASLLSPPRSSSKKEENDVPFLARTKVHPHSIEQGERWTLASFSIVGAELKNGKRLCVNYLRQRDLYERRIIFIILNVQKSFQINQIVSVPFVFSSPTKK